MTITGKEYVNRINQLKNDVWLDGQKITGSIGDHSAFRGVMQSNARLFDLQNDPSRSDDLTFTSQKTNKKVGFSFHQPKTKEDLLFRKQATETWARTNLGLLGRSPDYVNTGIMSLAVAEKLFAEADEKFGKNIRHTYELAMEKDLSFTHTFINPQTNRSSNYLENLNTQTIAAKVVRENSEGIVIQGARLLATQGGITDEVLVLPVVGKFVDEAYIYAFTIPSNTPGLTFICRESFAYWDSQFDHPLGSQFEEMDSIVVFDNVLVPWEKVFLYKDVDVVFRMFPETNFHTMLLYQSVTRMIVKTEFILGLAESIVDAINIREYQHIKDKVSEIIVTLEIMKALQLSAQYHAQQDKWGTMVPYSKPLETAINYYPKVYPRLVEIIQLLGGSGLILLPTEKSFTSPMRTYIDQYLQGTNSNAVERVQLFRIAWDFCMSAFGSRQTHYERFFFGDPVRLAMGLYNEYPRDEYTTLIKDLLKTGHNAN